MRTGQMLDLPVKQVQEWGNAFEHAGYGADAFAQSYRGINAAALEARAYGQGPATGIAQLYGINLHADNLSVMKQVADLVKRLHDEGQNVETQNQVLRAFGVAEDQLPLWQKGGAAIQELHDEEERAGVVSDTLVERGYKLEHSLLGLAKSAQTAGHTIAGDLQPTLQPVIDSFKTWLDELGKHPGAMKALEIGIGGLAAAFTVAGAAQILLWTARLTGLTAAIKLLAETPLKFLGPLGAGLAALWGGPLNEGEDAYIKAHPELFPQMGADFRAWWGGQHIESGFSPFRTGTAPGRGAPGAPPGVGGGPRQRRPGQYGAISSAPEAIASFERAGWTHEQAAGLAANLQAESGFSNTPGDSGLAQGFGQWHPDRQANFRRLYGHDVQDATAAEQYAFVDWELRNTESDAGARLARAKTAAEAGSIVSRYYERPKDTEGEAAARSSLATRLASPAAGSIVSRYYERPADTEGDAAARSSLATRLASPATGGAPPVQLGSVPSAGQQMADAGGGDSSHMVEVRFVDAPQGLRTGITRADGDARLSLRTQYALSAPF
jgi:Phage tail lysozyme